MIKKLILFLSLFLLFFFPAKVLAADNNSVTIVNPVRGNEFWDLKNQKPLDGVLGEMQILQEQNISATWLVRFDALSNQDIVRALSKSSDEKGLFLEVIPSWANASSIKYRQSEKWHYAGSVFLTAYSQDERIKLIDIVFAKFKDTFGFYPKSVGAWFIDSFSLGYMQKKYDIDASLIVADQYSTDNYQIWGQYFATPYYPQKKNILLPAQDQENKLPVVIMQWASRDPVNGYGKAVEESSYSLQANDYIDYHNFDTSYFSKLIDIYTNQKLNKFNQVVVGLENSYSWKKYGEEYKRQIQVLVDKAKKGQFSFVNMQTFANWYKENFKDISPQQIIVSDDPLGSEKKSIWFMNPFYRTLLSFNGSEAAFLDIRQYIENQEEMCFENPCETLNFASNATRALDVVTFGDKWVMNEGQISDLQTFQNGSNFVLSYMEQSGSKKTIEFLPRDISINSQNHSIDGAILEAKTERLNFQKNSTGFNENNIKLNESFSKFSFSFVKFIVFYFFVFFIPGLIIVRKILNFTKSFLEIIFFSSIIGIISFTLISYLVGFFEAWWILIVYQILAVLIFIKEKIYLDLIKTSFNKWSIANCLLIIIGSIFILLPVFKSGLNYSYGIGFWGPNAHDGIWHMSLSNQLKFGLPPQNPIFLGSTLKNYHYFYDLLLSSTSYILDIQISDLLFRFYPIILSILLGIGTYTLILNLFSKLIGLIQAQKASLFGLYFVYFAGSFGWIVDYLKNKSLNGESAFWANQSISLNLNPPFLVSLILIIAFIQLLSLVKEFRLKYFLILGIVLGSIIGFKTYGAILSLIALFCLGLKEIIIEKKYNFFIILIVATLIGLIILIPNFRWSSVFMFSPFWFIHSMIDIQDRLGWERLSLARTSSIEKGLWLKFILSESLGLLLFILGNLGLRIIGLLSIFKLNVFKNNVFLFLFIFSCLSLIIPIFFIQKGTPWNTIQFIYYSLYITSVFSGLALVWICQKLPRLVSFITIAVVIFLVPINSLAVARGYLVNSPHTYISNAELEALNFLSLKKGGNILTYPFDSSFQEKLTKPLPLLAYDSTAYVGALSKHPVFMEDEMQNEILENDYQQRRLEARAFFRGEKKIEWLTKNGINYIYLPKIYKINLKLQDLSLTKIFENNEVFIFKRN